MRKKPSHAQTWQHFNKRRIQVMVHLCLCHDNASGSKEVFRNIKRRALSLSFQKNENKSKDKKIECNAAFISFFIYRERDIQGGARRRTARK